MLYFSSKIPTFHYWLYLVWLCMWQINLPWPWPWYNYSIIIITLNCIKYKYYVFINLANSKYYSTSFAPVTTDLSLTAHQQISRRSSVLAEQRDTTHSMHCHGNSWGSIGLENSPEPYRCPPHRGWGSKKENCVKSYSYKQVSSDTNVIWI